MLDRDDRNAAVITALFTAIRGSVFTLAMARLNMRVRIELFASLLQQELAFFDITKIEKLIPVECGYN